MKLRPIACAIAAMCAPALTHAAAPAPQKISRLETVTVEGDRIRAGSPKDVVTTGSKTAVPLRDLPAAVAVVTREVLLNQGAIDMNSAMVNASGVQPTMAGGYGFADNYTIRGLAMRFLRDGYPDGTSQNGYWRTMYDVNRIEVLKGPGSALYGSGQPGGTVNVVSKRPRPEFAAELGALGGSFGTRGAYADVSGGLDDDGTVLARVIADIEHEDGFRDLERDIREFSPTLVFNYASDKTLTIDFDYRDIEIVPDNYGIVFGYNRRPADVDSDTKYYSPMNYANQSITRTSVSHAWDIASELTMNSALIHDRRDLEMLRNAGGGTGNAQNEMTGRNVRTQDDAAEFSLAQNELVWTVEGDSVKQTILGGIEYSHTRIDTIRVGYDLPSIANIHDPVVVENSLEDGTQNNAQFFDRHLTMNSFGVYLQDQLEFGRHFKARIGLRSDRVDARDEGVQGTAGFRIIDVEDRMNSGTVGLVWQPTENYSFYTGVSTGRFVNLATEATALPAEPEESLQKEIGMKAVFLDGNLDVNMAVFDTERDNYFVILPSSPDPVPEGKDTTRGVDIDLGARPFAGYSVLASLIVQDPQNESENVVTNSIFSITDSVEGKRPTGVAKRQARIWNEYEFQQAALRGWGTGLGVTYKDDSYADALNLYAVPSYTVWDASVFYRTRQWEANLSLRNLGDKEYYTSPTFSGALPGEERNALLSVRWLIGGKK